MRNFFQVCVRLANPPEAPGGEIRWNLGSERACGLKTSPGAGGQAMRVVVENPVGGPELRFFYLEANAAHIDGIVGSLALSSKPEDWIFRRPLAKTLRVS